VSDLYFSCYICIGNGLEVLIICLVSSLMLVCEERHSLPMRNQEEAYLFVVSFSDSFSSFFAGLSLFLCLFCLTCLGVRAYSIET
jgi:hypothetical protein